MKKLLKLSMAVLMTVSLVGCAKEEPVDYKADYLAAVEKTEEFSHLDMEMDYTIKLMGMKIDMPITSRMIRNGDDITAMELEMETMGTAINMAYVDDYMYMEMEGIKVKCEATAEEFLSMTQTNVDVGSAVEMIEDVTPGEVDADGNQVYNVTISLEEQNKMLEGFGFLSEGQTVEFKTFTYVATVNKEGYLTKVNVEMTFEYSEDGVTYDTEAILSVVYNNIGETFEIVKPLDADDYMEYNIEDLLE